MDTPLKSNLEVWKTLQERDYFGTHACYRQEDGSLLTAAADDVAIERYLPLTLKKRVAVIGCGYGRDVAVIAPKVGHVWGIDVSTRILDKAVAHLHQRGCANFTPVLAERWKEDLPGELDFVYCCIVFQHLTRDLVRDYVLNMPAKLVPGGEMLYQFAELSYGVEDADPDKTEEPSVRWSADQIRELASQAGLTVRCLDTQHIEGHGFWHWAHLIKDGDG